MLSKLPKATQLESNTVKLDSRSVCVIQRTPPGSPPSCTKAWNKSYNIAGVALRKILY